MSISPDNSRLLERQFVSYIRRCIPDYDDMPAERQTEIAWAFYAGVTAFKRAMDALSPRQEPTQADIELGVALVEEVESIVPRMHAGTLRPVMADYPARPARPIS